MILSGHNCIIITIVIIIITIVIIIIFIIIIIFHFHKKCLLLLKILLIINTMICLMVKIIGLIIEISCEKKIKAYQALYTQSRNNILLK